MWRIKCEHRLTPQKKTVSQCCRSLWHEHHSLLTFEPFETITVMQNKESLKVSDCAAMLLQNVQLRIASFYLVLRARVKGVQGLGSE